VRKLRFILGLSLLAVTGISVAAIRQKGPNSGIFAPPVAAGGGGATLSVENFSGGVSSAAVTSATETITTTANTTLVVTVIAYRRNSGQSVNATTLNGVDMPTSTQTAADVMRVRVVYSTSPGVGTWNVCTTMSASVPGFAMRTMTFTGTTTNPLNELQTTGSVTTSTLTFTTNTGDLVLTGMTKQDSSTSEPALNATNTTLWYDTDFNSAGAGNGGHFKIAISSSTGSTKAVNYSWTTAANHAFAGCVIR
jgi:hypothetical protein